MSRWECDSGHILEGFFYTHSSEGVVKMPSTIICPQCQHEMNLCGEESARELLKRVREFVGRASQHPDYVDPGSNVLTDLGKLETAVRKLADDAMRP